MGPKSHMPTRQYSAPFSRALAKTHRSPSRLINDADTNGAASHYTHGKFVSLFFSHSPVSRPTKYQPRQWRRASPVKRFRKNNSNSDSNMKTTITLLLAISTLVTGNLAAKSKPNAAGAPADPGWPRERTNEQGRLIYYQPQVDAWTNFKQLDFRMAFSLTPKGGKEIVGILELQAQTDVNVDDRSVVISNFKIKEVKLPGLDPAKTSTVDQMVRSFLPPDHTVVMALDRLVASVEKTQTPAAVPVQNDPPAIFVSNTPAILLNVDGEAVRADIAGTN